MEIKQYQIISLIVFSLFLGICVGSYWNNYNLNNLPVICDKLTDEGICLSNCFYSNIYMDKEYWHHTNIVPKEYEREYCGIIINREYIDK